MWALSTPKEKTPTAALRAAKRGGDFDLRATHAGKLLPAALTSVSFGFVLVRVRAVLLVLLGSYVNEI